MIDEDDSLGGLWLVISEVGIVNELRGLLDEGIELLLLEEELVLVQKLAEEERCVRPPTGALTYTEIGS
jgi:hypothetical protein